MQVERSARGFEQLYQAELDYVWSSLRRLGVAPAYVEDVTQEVFVTAWKKLDTYDASRPIRPWLFGIAFRLASDFRARSWTQREVFDDAPHAEDGGDAPDDAVAKRQAQALVFKALEAIPIDRRGVFVMHELDGTPVPEIAQALDVPLNTAYSRLRLARKDFAEAVEQLKGGARA